MYLSGNSKKGGDALGVIIFSPADIAQEENKILYGDKVFRIVKPGSENPGEEARMELSERLAQLEEGLKELKDMVSLQAQTISMMLIDIDAMKPVAGKTIRLTDKGKGKDK